MISTALLKSEELPLTLVSGNSLSPLTAGIFALLVLVCGCTSSGSDGSLKSQYPTLAEQAQMEEDHLQIFLENDQLGANGKPINIDSVKDMTIGAKVSTANSSYIVRPVFDLALLNKDNYLDVNLSSSTEAVTEMKLVSNKSATSHSEQEKYDFKASSKGWGVQASAAYHQENKREESSSDGSVNATMSYNNTGAYVELITGGFTGNANFTSYLIGSKVENVKSYVDYTESYVTGTSGNKYISALKITNGGQLTDQENVYGNIQLLAEMERIFGLMRTQYDQYSDATVRATLMTNLISMKSYISNAIKSFYIYHGDSFVSRINAMNYGLGNGQLQFGQSSGNTENIYSAALSVSYSGLGFGGSASANVGASRQNGWASAYKNTAVTARSLPANVIDTTAWANSIFSMLSNESAPISVPSLSLPSIGELILPPPAETKKDPAAPPDSCFGTYDDWKQYQNDKKANTQQDKQQAEAAQKKIDDQGVQKACNPAGFSDPQLYQSYATDLQLLKNKRSVSAPPLRGDNIMRVDKMFVSGFRTTTYDQVIPQLRPNLDIPGQSTKLAGFPNISTLLMVVDKLGQLNSYLHFLSGFAISKVSPEVSSMFDTFYAGFTSKAFEMISTQLTQGVDIRADLLASFSATWLGQEGSERDSMLYQAFNNIDAYNFITKTLLDPANAKIWSSAPGGYMPFSWNLNNQLSFSNLLGEHVGSYLMHSRVPFTDPMVNPLSFYEENKATIKSPWFPIFQYNQALPCNLLFLQMAGPYQIIHGYHYVTLPGNELWQHNASPTLTFNQMNPVVDAKVTGPLVDILSQSLNSYTGNLHWRYSLYFPNATPDPDMVRKYNVLTLPLKREDYPPAPSGYINNYLIKDYHSAYEPDFMYNWPCLSGRTRNVYQSGGGGSTTIVDMCTEGLYKDYGAILLLPINSTTCGDKFNNAFSYSTNLAATDIVQDNSYEATYKAAIMR